MRSPVAPTVTSGDMRMPVAGADGELLMNDTWTGCLLPPVKSLEHAASAPIATTAASGVILMTFALIVPPLID